MMRALLVLLLLSFTVRAADTPNGAVSLREYVDIRFDAQEKAVLSALAAADRAVAKAEAASERRFESVNEFRAALSDNTRSLMPRTEAEQQLKSMHDSIEKLTERVGKIEARGQGVASGWSLLVAGIGIVAAVVSIYTVTRKRVA